MILYLGVLLGLCAWVVSDIVFMHCVIGLLMLLGNVLSIQNQGDDDQASYLLSTASLSRGWAVMAAVIGRVTYSTMHFGRAAGRSLGTIFYMKDMITSLDD